MRIFIRLITTNITYNVRTFKTVLVEFCVGCYYSKVVSDAFFFPHPHVFFFDKSHIEINVTTILL